MMENPLFKTPFLNYQNTLEITAQFTQEQFEQQRSDRPSLYTSIEKNNVKLLCAKAPTCIGRDACINNYAIEVIF